MSEPETAVDVEAESTTKTARLASRKPALIVCVAAVLVSALMHGMLEGRWSDHVNLETVGGELNELPAKVGDWELASETELDSKAASMLQCHGSVVREYWKPATGERVNVFVLLGPRGPIAVHVPEVCYSSQGTEPVAPASMQTLDTNGRKDQFWAVQLRREGVELPHLEVWYAWSDGGAWEAANYPRMWLTDQLYKIQVAGPPAEAGQESPIEDFLKAFLPTVKQEALTAN